MSSFLACPRRRLVRGFGRLAETLRAIAWNVSAGTRCLHARGEGVPCRQCQPEPDLLCAARGRSAPLLAGDRVGDIAARSSESFTLRRGC